MMPEMILGILRHVLTTAGGGLVASGTLDASTMQTGAGAVMTLVGIGFSLWNKRNSGQK